MAVNDSYAKATDGIADGSSLIVDGSAAGTGAVNITEVGTTGAAEVYREVDTAQDGSWSVSDQIDSSTQGLHSQQNDLLCSQAQYVRLRIKNVSGGTADLWAVGYEVDN